MDAQLEFIELGSLSLREWLEVTGRHRAPFGERSASLVFRPKTHHIGIRSSEGELVAVGGATIATVEVNGHEPFDVVGLGGLIIRADMRGRGLAEPLMDRLNALTAGLGPDHAMLFCEPRLVNTYTRRNYRLISAPVWVEQPEREVLMPLDTMWRPVRPADWPPGTVRLRGLPF